MRVAVIGASGGIGRAMVEQLAQRADVEQIYALSRSGAAFDSEKVHEMSLDLEREDSIRAAATEISEISAPDQVILTAGILSEGDSLKPEKSLRQQERDAFERVFAINTIGPALVAKHFIPLLPRKSRRPVAMISSSRSVYTRAQLIRPCPNRSNQVCPRNSSSRRTNPRPICFQS